jgi:dienelactone hydrolase
MGAKMIRSRILLAVTGILAGHIPSAVALEETIEIQSRTLTDEEFLRADTSAGQPVTIAGRLAGPDRDGPQPVVMLLHGTDGPMSAAVREWRRFLNDSGFATFTLNSYSGRGFSEASGDQARFGQFSQIYDVYRAVETLAKDTRVDGTRIAVMGFSRGGNAALYSAMLRFQDAFGPKSGRIAAHLPFYPACNFELVDQLRVTDSPIREFHGAQDDWTPAAPCRAYIDALAAAGGDAKMTEYAGAHHAFDNPHSPERYSDPKWQTSRNCLRREVDAQLVNAATGKAFSYADACIEYGPSVQSSDEATEAARAAVQALLTEVFAPK